MKTAIGEISLIKIEEWPVQLSEFPWTAIRVVNRTSASFMFDVVDGNIIFHNDEEELNDLSLEEEAERCSLFYEHRSLVIDKLPENDYIKTVTGLDFVGLVQMITKDYPGRYHIVNDENDILIAFKLDKPVENAARLLMAMSRKIDKWSKTNL